MKIQQKSKKRLIERHLKIIEKRLLRMKLEVGDTNFNSSFMCGFYLRRVNKDTWTDNEQFYTLKKFLDWQKASLEWYYE